MARYNNPTYDSGNPWSRGFQNLGTAIFGDPQAQQDAALDATREATTIKTYEEINRGLRADKALEQLGEGLKAALGVPPGGTLTAEQISAAYPQLAQQMVLAGYDTGDFGNIINQSTALGGDDFAARRGYIASGREPGLDFTVDPRIAERIRREKPIVAQPGEVVHVPAPIYPYEQQPGGSMADTVAPMPQAAATGQPAATAQPSTAAPSAGGAMPPPDIKAVIDTVAAKYNVPPEVMYEVASIESGFDPSAVGDKYLEGGPSTGMWQFRPATAKGYNLADPHDVATSTDAAGRMLSDLYRQFGSWDKAIAAYNWGSGNLTDFGMENMPASTRGYVERVMARIGGGAQPTAAPMGDVFATGGQIVGPPKQQTMKAGETLVGAPTEGGPGTPIYSLPAEPSIEDVAPGHTIVVPQPDGSYKEVYQAPYSPEQADGEDGGAGGKPIEGPDMNDERVITIEVGNALGVPPKLLNELFSDMGVDGYAGYAAALDAAWRASNKNPNVAAAAAAKWIDDHYEITYTKPVEAKDNWDFFGAGTPDVAAVEENLTVTPKGAIPAPAPTGTPTATTAPAATTEAPPPPPANAADRVVGQVYMTAKFGPMKWAGDGWEEP